MSSDDRSEVVGSLVAFALFVVITFGLSCWLAASGAADAVGL